MLLEEISPFIRFCERYHWQNYTKFSICLDCRLFYIKNGEGEIIIDGKKCNFKKNTLILFQAGTKYKFSAKEAIDIISVNFDYTQKNNQHKLPYATVNFKSKEPSSIGYIEKTFFENALILEQPILINDFPSGGILKNLILEMNTKQPFYQEKMSSLLKTLIIDAVRAATLPENPEIEIKLNTVISYIQENYAEDINNEYLAKLVNYHPYYLNRIFKKYMGVTLHKYLLDYRISMAENLLFSTKTPIEKIAEQIGFNSTNCFISYFKKSKLLTPLQYRNRVRDNV